MMLWGDLISIEIVHFGGVFTTFCHDLANSHYWFGFSDFYGGDLLVYLEKAQLIFFLPLFSDFDERFPFLGMIFEDGVQFGCFVLREVYISDDSVDVFDVRLRNAGENSFGFDCYFLFGVGIVNETQFRY